MKFNHTLGIDVSKKTIDLALAPNQANATMLNQKFANNLNGFKKMLAWFNKQAVNLNEVLICLENTGIYHRALANFLQSQQAFVWVENALSIKWSGGLQRGKEDAMDARRICLYAFRNQDKAKPYDSLNQALQNLSDLLAARKRLINAKKALEMPIRELEEVGLKENAQMIAQACQKSLLALKEEIKALDKQIKAIINQEEELKKNYEYITSVKGVGMITAVDLIVHTHNFKRFGNAKQLASYSGVAPFPYSSGTSIRGKTQVHPMANKALKQALHMCALSAIRHDGEMRVYFERKVKEGKNKMSVLNAIRNKLLHRIYACVRDQRMYEYKQAA